MSSMTTCDQLKSPASPSCIGDVINPVFPKLFNFNFHPLEVVSRCRDPQRQVSEKKSASRKMEVNDIEILLIYVTLYI